MFPDHIELDMTAAEVRTQLVQLEAERSLAVDTGIADVAPDMADLDVEIELCRQLYTYSAVTEIATLRAEMFGPQLG